MKKNITRRELLERVGKATVAAGVSAVAAEGSGVTEGNLSAHSQRQGRTWLLESPSLKVRIDPLTFAVDVTDKRVNVTWKMLSRSMRDLTLEARGRGDEISLAHREPAVKSIQEGSWKGVSMTPRGAGVEIVILLKSDQVRFRLSPLQGSAVVFAEYPRPLILPRAKTAFSVIPVEEGFLLPGNFAYPVAIGGREMACATGLASSRKLAMPWWGQVNGASSFMALIETPDDATIGVRHPAGGPSRIDTLWLPSLGSIRYPRQATYIFRPRWNYVSMVQFFRRWMQERGEWKTLSEKGRESPRIEELRGAVHINAMSAVNLTSCYHSVCAEKGYTPYYHVNTFATIAKWMQNLKKEYHVDRAVLQLYGWSVRGADHTWPDCLPPNQDAGGVEGLRALIRTIHDLGYQFWLHVDFNDLYQLAPSFSPSLLVKEKDGSWPPTAPWAGGPSFHLCPLEAMRFIVRDVADGYNGSPGILELGADGVYLDTYPLDFECFDPKHRLTRSEARKEMIRQFRYLASKGLQTSVEDWDWYTAPYITDLWGHPGFLFEKKSPHHPLGVPVPLFSLAFHDCILLGFPPDRWLELSWLPHSTAFLYGLLWGGMLNMPLHWAPYDPLYGYSAYLTDKSPQATAEIQEELVMWKLARCVAFDQMTDHRILSPNAEIQESTFSSGVHVWVNFASHQYRITGCDGINPGIQEVRLPTRWVGTD